MPGPCITRPDLRSICTTAQQAWFAGSVRGLPGAGGYPLMEDDHRGQRTAAGQ